MAKGRHMLTDTFHSRHVMLSVCVFKNLNNFETHTNLTTSPTFSTTPFIWYLAHVTVTDFYLFEGYRQLSFQIFFKFVKVHFYSLPSQNLHGWDLSVQYLMNSCIYEMKKKKPQQLFSFFFFLKSGKKQFISLEMFCSMERSLAG